MKGICFYFEVHQPFRLKRSRVFDKVEGMEYFDNQKNKAVFTRIAEKCYHPANELFLKLIERYGKRFKIAYSLTGTFIEQCRMFDEKLLDSFRELAKTGCVEFLEETYYHSLAGLYEEQSEFKEQIQEHRRIMKEEINYEPKVFVNTELILDNRIAGTIMNMGYKGVITEGTEKILGDRSPNYIYGMKAAPGLNALLKNYKLSDDIAFRFSNYRWIEYPLFADKYAGWLAQTLGNVLNIFMDYETFGEHQWKETGIFQFMDHLPEEIFKHSMEFLTPSEVLDKYPPSDLIDIPFAISWADMERDVSAWLDNKMQQYAFNTLRDMRPYVLKKNNPELLHAWRLLQASDHYYYCSTKGLADGDIHKYFSPYENPYDAFINYSNIIHNLTSLLR